MKNSSHFYSQLDIVNDFKEITNTSLYKDVPSDWYLLLTDVKDSTWAIESGKYKEVNMLGALTIISILNLDKTIELPFVFGGDGAFVLIPPTLLNSSRQAFLSLEKLSRETYGLELRIGCIPISAIRNNDKDILIAKFAVSKDYSQAIIKGGGLEYGDTMLKTTDEYIVHGEIDSSFELDIDGLECRWESIPSPKDETISLLVKCNEDAYYKDVLENLDLMLGTNKMRHPIAQDNLNLSFSTDVLSAESALYAKNQCMKFFVSMKFKAINFFGSTLMKLKIGEWATYKNRIISTTDTEKFDDMLRMVISLSYEQVKTLEVYLEKEFKANTLVYGIHKADSALMTCLVFQRHGSHIHFVDSSDGGYAIAAKMMKKMVETKRTQVV